MRTKFVKIKLKSSGRTLECGVVLAYEHEELLFEEQVARNPKTIPSSLITAKLKSNSVVLRVDPSIMQRKVEDSYWMTSDGPTSNQWLRLEDWDLTQCKDLVHLIPQIRNPFSQGWAACEECGEQETIHHQESC